MEIFNTKILNNRQRWNRAIIYAIGATLISVIVCTVFQMYLIRSSFIYLAASYFISWVILESGHGVQKKFSILAAICVVATIFFSEFFSHLLFGANPVLAIYTVFHNLLFVDFNGLLSFLIKVYAVYMAYEKARVL